jgi:tetratricopeptide (TPR) repeat protein
MTILCLLMMTGLLSAQQPAADPRAEAERLARTGAYAEALQRFEAIAAANPDDLDARIWIGRMMQRLGHPDRAATVFRSVVAARPDSVPALVGLGGALAQMDQPDEAIPELNRAEKLAPDDPDLLAAQGAAHLAAGHVKLGLAYYRRAAVLRPGDPDIREAEVDARRRYGHFIAATGFFESYSVSDGDAPDAWSGSVELNARAADQLRLFARGQVQDKFDEYEWRGGGGLEWWMTRRVAFRGYALVGPDTTVLPTLDAYGEASYTKQRLTIAGGVQYVSFEPEFVGLETATAWFVTPTVTFRVNDDFSVFGRYTHSSSEFDESGASVGNDSGAVGARFRLVPQMWIGVSWAGGVEDFDTLSIDRLGDFNANTLKGDVRIDLASLTSIVGAYEYQWREADQQMMRATFGLVQRF